MTTEISFLGTYVREVKIYAHKKACTQCPQQHHSEEAKSRNNATSSAAEWINHTRYSYLLAHYLGTRRNEELIQARTGMHLENIPLQESSQSQRPGVTQLPLYERPSTEKTTVRST